MEVVNIGMKEKENCFDSLKIFRGFAAMHLAALVCVPPDRDFQSFEA